MKMQDEHGDLVNVTSWNGENPKYVVISDPGYYGFFTREGAEAFLAGDLEGKGQIREIKLNE